MTITVVFDPPLPSDSPATFNTKAFTLLGDLNDWSTEANALAVSVNADEAVLDAAVASATASASTATTQAGTATTQAGIATTQAGNAATSAGTATTQAGVATSKAGEANTSAIAAAASAATVSSAIVTERTATATLTNKTLTNPSYSGTTSNGGTVTTIDINGGTIDGTVIGGSSAAAGSFTTVSASGNIEAVGNLAAVSVAAQDVLTPIVVGRNSPSGTDYVGLYAVKDGAADQMGMSVQVWKENIGPVESVKFPSVGGLSVTGALSATGDVTLAKSDTTPAVVQITATNVNSQAAITKYTSKNASGTASTWWVGTNVISLNNSYEIYNSALGGSAVIIDTAGNLGLWVAPSPWGVNYKALQVNLAAFSYNNNNGNSQYSNNVYWDSSNNPVYLNSSYASYYAQAYTTGQHQWFTAPSGTAGNPISFTQAMTLDASGNLLVGTTSVGSAVATGGAQIFVNAYGTGQTVFDIGHIVGTSSGTNYARYFYNGSEIGSVSQSGTTAVLYNTTSDARLKENITDSADASSLIDALQVRQFDWKSDGSHQRYGFVAQELYEVAPEAVSKPQDPDEMMAVDYSKLVPMLVKEIQALRLRVAALEPTAYPSFEQFGTPTL